MRDQDTPSFISTRELLGIEVRDRNDYGRTLGRVASVILERSTGRAVYFVLEWGGLLGWDRDRVVVPYSLLHFAGQWDRPTLDVPADKIENAPQFQNQDLDTLLSDPAWQRAIADYFRTALTPGAPPSPSGPRQATQPGTAAPRAPTGADPKHGESLAQGICAACHTLNQGGSTRVGPNLFGVFERPVASVPGYNYSAALKAHHGAWDEANLNAFLKDPRADAPGTFMTFAGISSDSDRRDVIAYLESLKAGAAK